MTGILLGPGLYRNYAILVHLFSNMTLSCVKFFVNFSFVTFYLKLLQLTEESENHNSRIEPKDHLVYDFCAKNEYSEALKVKDFAQRHPENSKISRS